MTPTKAIAIIEEAAMTAAPTATEVGGATMSIVVTRNTLMIEAAITDTTSTSGDSTNTGVIGAHGTIGTGMPGSIPTSTNMDTITATVPI